MALSQIWFLQRASDSLVKSLADWGVAKAAITRRTQRPDVLEIKISGAKFDDTEIFAYQEAVTLTRGDGTWFTGVATKTPRMGRPNAEGMSYTIEGPWWWLEHVVYQQSWKFLNDPTDPTSENISNLILAVDNTGNPINTGAQITDALNCAMAAGANFQIGTIDPSLTVPSERARDITCAEVVRRMLRWHPDCVTWFDYTTTKIDPMELPVPLPRPCPTLHIRQRANLAVATFSVEGQPASAIDIAARPDLVPPVVALKYERVNQVDGESQRTITTDKYPADRSETQPGAVVMTIDLQGDRLTFVRQYLKTSAIDASSTNWWKERLPWLNDAKISSLTLASSSTSALAADGAGDTNATDKGSESSTGGTVYANFVLEGDIPDWIDGHAQMALVQALVSYDVDMGSGVKEHHASETLLAKVMSTDLQTGWYSQLSGVYLGEPVPTGLAQGYYEALQLLMYEGTWEITEEEIGDTGGPYLGKVLNLTGGLTEWTTMRAATFESHEDLATGKTRLRFGPVEYLSPKDWINWIRLNRWREIGDRRARVNGLLTMGGASPVGGTGKYDRGGAGGKGPPQFTVPVGSNKITVDVTGLDSIGSIPSDLTVKLRTVQVCEGGELKNVVALVSETYTP